MSILVKVRFVVCLILLLAIVALPTLAQEDTPDLILGGGTGELVYSANLGGTTSIYVINSDGTEVRQLTSDSGVEDWTPDWSPDGQSIVFNRHYTGLYIIDVDGGNLRALTQEDDYSPAWSPDGESVAFGSWRDDNLQLYIIDVESGVVTGLTDYYSYSPSWSLDGESILFIGEDDTDIIYTISTDGNNLTEIYALSGNLSNPAFSPDGKMIAVQVEDNGTSSIAILNLFTQEVRYLADDLMSYYAPDWSPDGEWLAFQLRESGGGICDSLNNVYIVDAFGENLQQVTTEGGCFPDWRPLPINQEEN